MSYGTDSAAAGTATCPMVEFFKRKHLQGEVMGKGCSCCSRVPVQGVCMCRSCSHYSLPGNYSTPYAMIDEALSTGCGLLDGEGVTATWISLTQKPLSMLPGLLIEVLDTGYSFIF